MKKMGIGELKARLSEAVSEVQGGETIEVTKRGKVVALLIPVHRRVSDDDVSATLASLGALRAEIGKRVTEPTDVTQLLREMRDSRW